jgi:hypothetical protein
MFSNKVSSAATSVLIGSIMALAAIVVPPGADDPCSTVTTSLRVLLPEYVESVGRLQMAAQLDISAVHEAQATEEPPPGVSASQFKVTFWLFRILDSEFGFVN